MHGTIRYSSTLVAAVAALLGGLTPAGAQTVNYQAGQNGAPNGGQINISGATLFADFFNSPASTNDFINADGDMVMRGPPCNDTVPIATFLDSDCDGFPDTIDQLAPNFTCPNWNGYWLVQYRSVGSVEGFGEFVGFHTIAEIPTAIPSERGLINRQRFATAGVIQSIGSCPVANCDPSGPESGTPVCPTSIDISSTDVPLTWVVRVETEGAGAAWNQKPTLPGYGLNPIPSNTGFISQLESLTRDPDDDGPMPPVSLNTNFAMPDNMTVYDTQIAWSPVATIANAGTGVENIRFTELQHLFVTGRMPNGENLVGATRDVGSGTRNAWTNSVGIDPAWARGDNIGDRIDDSLFAKLGPGTQPTNCGGSSIQEESVQQHRLAIGYTGLAGSSRAAKDAVDRKYEVINVCKDIDGDGDGFPDSDCTPSNCFDGAVLAGCNPFNPGLIPDGLAAANNGYVRASIDTCLDNADPRCGYQIGGSQTFSTVGDPRSNGGMGENPEMVNLNARNYIRNISESILAFEGNPGVDEQFNMPGEYMANSFFLVAAVDAFAELDPTDFIPNVGLNQTLQDYVRCNNGLEFGGDTPAFGGTSVAGTIPDRRPSGTPSGFMVTYSDGSTDGDYLNAAGAFDLTNSLQLNHRNRVSGDFNYDCERDITDVDELVKALCNPRRYQKNEIDNPPAVPACALPLPGGQSYNGTMGGNYCVPEIMGDFNGDGNFDAEDARYFADGLAVDPLNGGFLNRAEAFEQLDLAWMTHRPAILTTPPAGFPAADICTTVEPCWHPTLPGYIPAWPDTAALGAAVADISSATADTTPGAAPSGHDGVVNGYDIDYVHANFGNFADINVAVFIDLSADMNGDLLINQDDVDKVVQGVLCTHYGDANLDGLVDADDIVIVEDTVLNGCIDDCGWAQGDFNGDGVVDMDDLDTVNNNQGLRSPCMPCSADIDGDGMANSADAGTFTDVLTGANTGVFESNRADFNGDGSVDGDDIQHFIDCLFAS